jgi:hypothetical protein
MIGLRRSSNVTGGNLTVELPCSGDHCYLETTVVASECATIGSTIDATPEVASKGLRKSRDGRSSEVYEKAYHPFSARRVRSLTVATLQATRAVIDREVSFARTLPAD